MKLLSDWRCESMLVSRHRDAQIEKAKMRPHLTGLHTIIWLSLLPLLTARTGAEADLHHMRCKRSRNGCSGQSVWLARLDRGGGAGHSCLVRQRLLQKSPTVRLGAGWLRGWGPRQRGGPCLMREPEPWRLIGWKYENSRL